MKNAFEVKNPDFDLSPHTGMTKQHYVDCAKYLLKRAFNHVESIDIIFKARLSNLINYIKHVFNVDIYHKL